MAFRGIKILELVGLAPVPFCGMIFADQGARVIRISNPRNRFLEDTSFVRGKETLPLDLKNSHHRSVFRRLCSQADVLLDPNRTGVLERLSLAPADLQKDNPGLIVARITGYGQAESPKQLSAGHDLNYLAEAGVLSILKEPGQVPKPPVNFLADFAGGGLTCAFGIAAALFERSKTGQGQVIDCSMTEGAAYVASFRWLSRDLFFWSETAGRGVLDGGAHFYRCYGTKDAKFVAVAAIEPQFYAALLKGLGLAAETAPQFGGDSTALQAKFAAIFASKTADEWGALFDGVDACVTPVREWNEVRESPLARACGSFLKDGSPAPAPRLSGHPNLRPATQPLDTDPRAILAEHGFSADEISQILKPSSKL